MGAFALYVYPTTNRLCTTIKFKKVAYVPGGAMDLVSFSRIQKVGIQWWPKYGTLTKEIDGKDKLLCDIPDLGELLMVENHTPSTSFAAKPSRTAVTYILRKARTNLKTRESNIVLQKSIVLRRRISLFSRRFSHRRSTVLPARMFHFILRRTRSEVGWTESQSNEYCGLFARDLMAVTRSDGPRGEIPRSTPSQAE